MELYLPAEERREILRDYGRRWGLRVFIETGTNNGDTPWTLMDDFDHLYTIELDSALFWAAKVRFADYPKVGCLIGDSTEVLPDLLKRLDQPALVWLDGHYCGPGTGHGTLSTPIREELRVLLQDRHSHIILVDDARIFDGQPEHDMYDHYADYPSLEWIEEYARQYGYDYEMADDIVRLTP